ncbi:hypothetical protein KP509_11G003600 [Ceratopteris richardii]|uniref:Leucine-rich repeat-containing N-terminal plant-type domain-containing protein n=1 Tax=Ceratopteris richardii TaxID=49495 RepID=A0A8T2TRG5_CERRI|nr:hypothetical protein KP509_11G003600 [Ceratopteris richardii]
MKKISVSEDFTRSYFIDRRIFSTCSSSITSTRNMVRDRGDPCFPKCFIFLVFVLLAFGRVSCETDPLSCLNGDDNDGIISTPGIPVCSSKDRNALLSFKASIISDPNNVLANWRASHYNCCDWTGVTCDSATGRVVRLNLYSQHLHGTLNAGLSRLSFLQVLILNNNDFFGSIPSSFGGFRRLERLCLAENPSLSGSIPEAFRGLKNLQLMDLYGNSLSGPLPSSFGMMSSLRNIHLYGNKISGPIPPSFGLLSNLYNADLSNNRFSGPIADAFAFGLTSLIFLDLHDNEITGLPKDMRNLTKLQWIDLSNNPLMTGDSVEGIATAPEISQIEMSSCNISGPFPAWVSRLPQPDWGLINDEVTPSLNLANNAIYGRIPSSLGKLVNLEFLNLEENRLTGSIPPTLGKLQGLRGFNVSYNKLSGKIPQVYPLTTFDRSSYQPGNLGLCGVPLTPCK